MNYRHLFAEIFGLIVRVLGLWVVFLGVLCSRDAIRLMMARHTDGDWVVYGALISIVGAGILRYADLVVRFSYRHIADDDRE